MQSAVYLLSAVAGGCALWFVWNFAIRKLMLDAFRERLFGLRFELYRLGMNGDLSFDNEAYRAIETLLCGLLRFGHRITLLTYVFSSIEQKNAQKEKDYVDTSQQIALKVSRLEPTVQEKIADILNNVRTAILLYMAFSSLFFLTLAFLYTVAKLLGLRRTGTKKKVSGVIEREAYRIESHRHLRPLAA